MPIHFGTVMPGKVDQALTVQLDGGEEVPISQTTLIELGIDELPVGARVRVMRQGSEVISLVMISESPSSEIKSQQSAHIVSIDRWAKTLLLETPQGKGTFGPIELTPGQWARLAPGAKVTLRRTRDGKYRLELPQSESPQSGRSEPASELKRTVQVTGTVMQVSPYHVVVQGIDDKQYGFTRTDFPGQAFQEGDEVTFRVNEDSFEIIDIALLRRGKVEGWGGEDPCGKLLKQILNNTGREGLKELIQRLCDDGRLDWYWVTPEKAAQMVKPAQLDPTIIEAICQAGDLGKPDDFSLYSHQAKALETLKAGRHVLVLTPTASGKTNCYNPAIFTALQNDPTARALYVFPLNALLQDQVAKLKKMADAFRKRGIETSIDLLIGGLEAEQRQQMEVYPPQILGTNPEMLNWLLTRNAYGGWPDFLRRVRFIVLDEVHTYRSLLGLHMASLVRRLLIACRRHGNPGPQFVLSSATIGDPKELPYRLTSLPQETFTIIDESEDGSAQQQRHWLVLPATAEVDAKLHERHLYQAAQVLVEVLTLSEEALNAIVFAKSSRDVRFIHRTVVKLLDEQQPDLTSKVKPFAGAFLSNEERRKIYEQLRDGQLRAVVSTNALEAGIDIGKLDVCIIAGFPFFVMRMRQMAGRAGRQKEGVVIFIPHPIRKVDRFYANEPSRLLSQPPETFVVDYENPYVARKHVVACAASMSGGVQHQELEAFGRHLDRIIQEATTEGVVETLGGVYTTSRRHQHGEWAIGNMRSAEQDPYLICKAPAGQRNCQREGCLERSQQRSGEEEICPHLVQPIDRQYVYREAHPGAIFESLNGDLYDVEDFDDVQKLVWAHPLDDDSLRRTSGAWETTVEILQVTKERELVEGVILILGEVRVTEEYSGFLEHKLVPRRRCPKCRKDYAESTKTCPTCKRRLRHYMASTNKKYRDFPGKYKEKTYKIELDTVACWLMLPTNLEMQLETVSRCKIPHPNNQVLQFLQAKPPFKNPVDLAETADLSPDSSKIVFDYFEQHRPILTKSKPPEEHISLYPAFYGQCLRHHLRQHLPEPRALDVFGRVTGYPVLSDERHVCRNCVGSMLIPAAHTLEHLIALHYPKVALGDSQDLGFVTSTLHPQTRTSTIFWYDNYKGGIGAAEKIFDKFDTLLHKALDGIECNCSSDEGCPLCIQTLRCERWNEGLSKAAAIGLIQLLLGLPQYIPKQPLYKKESEPLESEAEAQKSEFAAEPVPTPDQSPPPPDPFWLLRVQPHVHDKVLQRALEVRAEEIGKELIPVSVQILQEAYKQVEGFSRPKTWQFPLEWNACELLHIHPEASKRLAHIAYKIVISNVHPDMNMKHLERATKVTQRVNAAWAQLKEDWAQAENEPDNSASNY